jgi:hypothetical protein
MYRQRLGLTDEELLSRLLLPLQQTLFAGGDDRTDRQCGLLLYALRRTGSQGRGGLWVIKFPQAFLYGGSQADQ